jgi:hypothetical protein
MNRIICFRFAFKSVGMLGRALGGSLKVCLRLCEEGVLNAQVKEFLLFEYNLDFFYIFLVM